MANIGDKFIIEIDEKYNKPINHLGNTPKFLYKIKGFNSLVFDENGISKLQKAPPKTQETVAYQDGYKYGVRLGWLLASKIVKLWHILDQDEICNIFGIKFEWGASILDNIWDKLSFDTCLKKLNDACANFQAGDEVAHLNHGFERMVVVYATPPYLYGCVDNGEVGKWTMDRAIKVGRMHQEIKDAVERNESGLIIYNKERKTWELIKSNSTKKYANN